MSAMGAKTRSQSPVVAAVDGRVENLHAVAAHADGIEVGKGQAELAAQPAGSLRTAFHSPPIYCPGVCTRGSSCSTIWRFSGESSIFTIIATFDGNRPMFSATAIW